MLAFHLPTTVDKEPISDESKSQQKLLKKLLAKELPEGGYYIDTESPYITANTTIVEASITLAQIYYLSN